MNRQASLLALVAPGLGSVLAAGSAGAAWDTVPQLTLTAEAEDNARLLPGDQPSSSRMALDGRLRIARFSERGQAYIEPRFISDAYADEVDRPLEHDDLFLRTGAERTMPRANFSFASDFRQQSVLRSEIDEALDDEVPLGPDEAASGAGTLGAFDDVRERFSIALAGDFAVADRTELGFDTSWIDVAYQSPSLLQRSDFDSTTLGMTLRRSVDERNDVAARVYAMDYAASRNDNESRALGVSATFERPLSGTLSFAVDVGVVRTEFNYIGAGLETIDGVTNGFTFQVDVEKSVEATSLLFSAGRSVSPGTTGFLAPRDDLSFSLRHRVTPRFRISGGLRAASIDVGENALTPPRDYLRATIEMDWAFSERLSLLGGYDRIREQFGGGALETEVHANSLFIGLRYQGRSQL